MGSSTNHEEKLAICEWSTIEPRYRNNLKELLVKRKGHVKALERGDPSISIANSVAGSDYTLAFRTFQCLLPKLGYRVSVCRCEILVCWPQRNNCFELTISSPAITRTISMAACPSMISTLSSNPKSTTLSWNSLLCTTIFQICDFDPSNGVPRSVKAHVSIICVPYLEATYGTFMPTLRAGNHVSGYEAIDVS